MFGLRPGVAILFHHLTRHNPEDLVGQHTDEEGRRQSQRDAQRVIIDRFNADVFAFYWYEFLTGNRLF